MAIISRKKETVEIIIGLLLLAGRGSRGCEFPDPFRYAGRIPAERYRAVSCLHFSGQAWPLYDL